MNDELYKCVFCGARWLSETPKEGEKNITMDIHLAECSVFLLARRNMKLLEMKQDLSKLDTLTLNHLKSDIENIIKSRI